MGAVLHLPLDLRPPYVVTHDLDDTVGRAGGGHSHLLCSGHGTRTRMSGDNPDWPELCSDLDSPRVPVNHSGNFVALLEFRVVVPRSSPRHVKQLM